MNGCERMYLVDFCCCSFGVVFWLEGRRGQRYVVPGHTQRKMSFGEMKIRHIFQNGSLETAAAKKSLADFPSNFLDSVKSRC